MPENKVPQQKPAQSQTSPSFSTNMDILVMLPIAVLLDLACLLAFVLSLFGIGFALQEFFGATGDIVMGIWIITRAGFSAVSQKIQKKKGPGNSIITWIVISILKLIPIVGDFVPYSYIIWREYKKSK